MRNPETNSPTYTDAVFVRATTIKRLLWQGPARLVLSVCLIFTAGALYTIFPILRSHDILTICLFLCLFAASIWAFEDLLTRLSTRWREGATVVPLQSPAEFALPLLGQIAAGRPIETVQEGKTISFRDIVDAKNVFVLKVKGPSMKDEHIVTGDYVLVERSDTICDGELVVALVDGSEITLKRIYREGSKIRLQPSNNQMAAILLDKKAVQVQGRVILILRRY